MASEQSSSMLSGATVMPNYSSIFPAPFHGATDFEHFVTQFISVPLFLIEKTNLKVICLLNSSLPASVATI